MLTDYRSDYSAMQQMLAVAEYQYLSGSQPLNLKPIYSRYCDLWRLSTIEELKAAQGSVHNRAAVDRLWSAAHEMRIRHAAHELDTALEQARANFEEQIHSLAQLRAKLAIEPLRARRFRIYRVYAELVASRNDLRQERMELLKELAQRAGYSSPLELYSEVRRTDYHSLDAQMQQFLAHTERAYTIAREARLRRLGISPLDAHRADSLYFLSITEFDELYPSHKLLLAWRETMSEMGVRTYAQKELQVGNRVREDVGAFAVRLSAERIYLGLHPALGGLKGYEQFFHVSAKAELMAYTSPQLQLEFRYAGDKALEEGYGLLLASIVTEPAWLERMGSSRDSGDLLKLTALARLARLRYWAALLHYELSLYTTGGGAYAEEVSAATGFKFEGVEHLMQPALESAYKLRGAIFEALLREYMMTRYGRAWWTSTRAGGFLKELWNTGYRYDADELAAQIGLGPLCTDSLEVNLLFRLKV